MSESLQPHELQHSGLASLSFTICWSLLKFMSIQLLMLTNHLILCRPLLLLPSVIPSNRVFSNESALHISWPNYWSFSFIIRPFSEYSGLISFRTDWLDLLAVQGTLKNLLQDNWKASIFWHSAFFTVQLSYPYMTTGKTFVSKVMSLVFNNAVYNNNVRASKEQASFKTYIIMSSIW